MTRTILCVDADYFYAQVELLNRKELEDHPVGVVQQHIVVTCNYVARNLGVRKLMRTSDAQKQCPELRLFDGSDLAPYRRLHGQMENTIRAHLAAQTELVVSVERQGLDEFFIDVTDVVAEKLQAGKGAHHFVGRVSGGQNDDYDQVMRPLMTASHICSQIRKEVKDTTGLTCSGGIGTTRMAAKWAANVEKPNGQTSLLHDGVDDKLGDCQVRTIPGVGWKLESLLAEKGIKTVAELRKKYTLSELQKLFGVPTGKLLFDRCRGLDDSMVQDKGHLKVITVEEAAREVSNSSLLRQLLKKLTGQLVPRLMANFVSTKRMPTTLTVKFRLKAGTVHRKSTAAPIGLTQLMRKKNSDLKAADLLVDAGMKLLVPLLPPAYVLSLVGIGITGFSKKPENKGAATLNAFFGGG